MHRYIACGAYGKKLKKFHARCHVRCLETRTTCMKLFQIFTIGSTCYITLHPQVSWFSEFVWILYNLKTLWPQLCPHVSLTRCEKYPASSWIWPQNTLTSMTIIFRMIRFHYSMHLQSKLAFCEINQQNKNNSKNIVKSHKIQPNFNMYFKALYKP